MFARWQRLQQRLNGAGETPGTYSGSKMAAGRYQRAMLQFTSALQEGGLGTWLRKPPEVGHFNVTRGTRAWDRLWVEEAAGAEGGGHFSCSRAGTLMFQPMACRSKPQVNRLQEALSSLQAEQHTIRR
ncbi:Double-stranded RNA-specific editase B2 [Liparis tanakae]|uniref:Double-stranded RNA-specific editase B2 n=1 Tax=Liparis tanakae TaxID=230148 RepID=A0A4Z2EY63_9TELE|nr:Double-stranded RNA-specific editase B2 [Liparis tanakae]